MNDSDAITVIKRAVKDQSLLISFLNHISVSSVAVGIRTATVLWEGRIFKVYLMPEEKDEQD